MKCILDNQHGIKMTDEDYQLFLEAEESVKQRNKSKEPAECDLVLAYARLKTAARLILLPEHYDLKVAAENLADEKNMTTFAKVIVMFAKLKDEAQRQKNL